MSSWDIYDAKVELSGFNKREALLNRASRSFKHNLRDNLSYKEVTVNEEKKHIVVLSTEKFNEKKINTLPGEHFDEGDMIFWKDSYWLVTEKDADDTIYEKAKMTRCNYLLKWVSKDSQIHSQWCVVVDSSQTTTSETESSRFSAAIGNAHVNMLIAKNNDTILFNRESRFLIDDPNSEFKLAYYIAKPLKTGSIYNDKGIYLFSLQETTTTDEDNIELSIADYYKYFKEDGSIITANTTIQPDDTLAENDDRKVWF